MLLSRKPRRKILLALTAIIALFILILVIAIFFLNYSTNKNTEDVNIINTRIQEFIVELDEITTPEDKKNNEYSAAIIRFNDTISAPRKQDKYEPFYFATSRVQMLYTDTNNPKLYNFINKDLNNFAKKYFPDKYEENSFLYPCQDPECAEEPQPEEIKAIILEIENGDFSDNTKLVITASLNSASYLDDKLSRFDLLINTVRLMNTVPAEEEAESLSKIASKLEKYIETAYSEEYSKYIKHLEESKILQVNE